MVGERRVETEQKYSELSKTELFAKLKRNEILEDLDKIEDGKDLIEIANKYKYEDPLLE